VTRLQAILAVAAAAAPRCPNTSPSYPNDCRGVQRFQGRSLPQLSPASPSRFIPRKWFQLVGQRHHVLDMLESVCQRYRHKLPLACIDQIFLKSDFANDAWFISGQPWPINNFELALRLRRSQM